MKAVLWGVFAVCLLLWTGLAWMAAALTEWSTQALGSERVVGGMLAMGEGPLPAWLALWLGPETVEAMAATVRWLLQLSAAVLPAAAAAAGWLVPLIWVGWGIGAVLLLVAAVAAHLLGTRLWGRRGKTGIRERFGI